MMPWDTRYGGIRPDTPKYGERKLSFETNLDIIRSYQELLANQGALLTEVEAKNVELQAELERIRPACSRCHKPLPLPEGLCGNCARGNDGR
jgi:hypothetical protein